MSRPSPDQANAEWQKAVANLVFTTYAAKGRNATSAVVTVFQNIFRGYEIEALSDAFSCYLATNEGDGVPTAENILSLINGGSLSERAIMAFSEVQQAIRCLGPYRSVAFPEPAASEIVQEKGWVLLNSMTPKDLEFYGNEFRRHFSSKVKEMFMGRAPYCFHVTGILEAENRDSETQPEVFFLNARSQERFEQTVRRLNMTEPPSLLQTHLVLCADRLPKPQESARMVEFLSNK